MAQTPTRTISDACDAAIILEQEMQSPYIRYAKLFQHNEPVQKFWQMMIADEDTHIASLRLILESLQNPDAPCPPALDNKIRLAMQRIAQLKERKIESLQDAFEIAHELEFSEINAVFESLTQSLIDHCLHRKFVHINIEVHQQRLIDFSDTVGDADWRRTITPIEA